MILLRPFKAFFSILLTSCLIFSIDCHYQTLGNSRNNATTIKFYELKFQTELDNVTVVKQESQQQIFKCQIRLAPVSQSQYQSSRNGSEPSRPRFKSSSSFVLVNQTTLQAARNRPSNWSLSIDWLKDDQLINGSEPDAIAVINVELKSNNSSASNGLPSKNDKRNKTKRIEIRNTSNGNQMKLTSRLRLAQLRGSDSGQYKCIARVSFEMPVANVGDPYNAGQWQRQPAPSDSGLSSASNEPTSANTIQNVEQTLESKGATLIVANKTNGDEQEGGTKPERVGGGGSSGAGSGSLQKLSLGPYGRRRQQLLFQGGTTTAQQNNLAGQDIHQLKHNTNDTQHATTKALTSEHHLEGGHQAVATSTTSTATNASSPQESSGSVAAARNELGGHDSNEHNGDSGAGGSPWPNSGRSSFNQVRSKQVNQFEDDEDLFKMEQERIEFISGQRRVKTAKTSGAGGSTNDDEDEFQRRTQQQQQQHERYQSTVQANNELSVMGDEWGPLAGAAASEDDLDSNNESSLATSNNQPNGNDRGPFIGTDSMKEDMSLMDPIGSTAGRTTNYGGSTGVGGGNRDSQESPPPSVFTMNRYLGSFDSTRMRLVKLVHKIAPELSCYTGNGEHYRGNVSVSADRRPCMGWPWIRSLGFVASTLETQDDHHNYCRNPNGDPHGPWCFVQYVGAIDGLHYEQAGNSVSGTPRKDNNSYGGSYSSNNLTFNGTFRYVPRPCSISPCSDYLWLYIVAPPLGLLVLLSCLLTMLVRSIRKSHYQTMISIKRHTMPKFKRLLSTRAKFGTGRGKKCGVASYLDEDIFEIVDDLDWSDGQTQSLSPKSNNTESLKLDSSFSSASSNTNDLDESCLIGCKSSNPMFCNDRTIDHKSTTGLLGGNPTGNKSAVSQVGPMFATLRCHIRASDKSSHQSTVNRQFCNKPRKNLLDQCDLATSCSNGRLARGVKSKTGGDWVLSQLVSSSSSNFADRHYKSQQSKHSVENHLISCSTTTSSIVDDESVDSSTDCKATCASKMCIKGTELPQLSGSCVCYLPTEQQQQPIFEGKFSQVLLAHLKKRDSIEKSQGETALASGDMSPTSSDCGDDLHLVAICFLKPGAAIDPSALNPSNLKLHNLNHLNLLKLIGYARLDPNEIGLKNYHHQPPIHSLVYDMAQLVDLSDWLKQQNKDMMTTNEPNSDLMIRKNLTCFAKQLALAMDYLHDQEIIYKDLACRNCFLDPTKMLIKLASFNIEVASDSAIRIEEGEATNAAATSMNTAQNLGSMIRPKYLLDYYVIDSRPADCQLLPLSWIPLESILFNKFNKQTDVWSFGCLLYELFSLGKVAYFGYSSKQIIDAVRSNLMPPQPLLCPNGIYKLMCKCLSDIPSIRPNVKQIYEQLNLFSGQCGSFLDHHLCSLATTMYDDKLQRSNNGHLIELKPKSNLAQGNKGNTNSITKTKSYANIGNFNSPSYRTKEVSLAPDYNDPRQLFVQRIQPEVGSIPISKSTNLADAGGSRLAGSLISGIAQNFKLNEIESYHYDEPVVVDVKKSVGQDL